MAKVLESPVVEFDLAKKIEAKICERGDFSILEDEYASTPYFKPSSLGVTAVDARLMSQDEVAAGGCSPVDAFTFFDQAVHGITLHSDWTSRDSLWNLAEEILSSTKGENVPVFWTRYFALEAPEQLEDRFKPVDEEFGLIDSMPQISISRCEQTGEQLPGAPAWTPFGKFSTTGHPEKHYWDLHPQKFDQTMENAERIPNQLDGWQDAAWADVLEYDENFEPILIGICCELPASDQLQETYHRLIQAAEYCLDQDPFTFDALRLAPPRADKDAGAYVRVGALLSEIITSQAPRWTHWTAGRLALGGKDLFDRRHDLSRFPINLNGLKIPLTGFEIGGEQVFVYRKAADGGEKFCANLLTHKSIGKKIHAELENLIGLPLEEPNQSA